MSFRAMMGRSVQPQAHAIVRIEAAEVRRDAGAVGGGKAKCEGEQILNAISVSGQGPWVLGASPPFDER